jgi:AraC-like DNA-binding protein
MNQEPASKRPQYLAVSELRPTVHLAGYYHFNKSVCFQYRMPSHHLILIESGRIEAQTMYGVFQAKANDLLCFRPAEWNQYETHSPASFYQIIVDFAGPPRHRLTPFLQGIGPLPAHLSLGDASNDARDLFETVCLEITQKSVVNQLRLRAAIYELLAVVAAAIVPSHETVHQLDPWLRIQQQLDFTLNKELKIKDMARQLNLSAEYFIRQFKNYFAISPKAYHMQVRLQEAVRILHGGDKSIKEVASRLGFNSPKTFTRCFKNHFGMIPSELQLSPPSKTMENVTTSKRPFLINQHLLPVATSPSFFERYVPKKKPTATTLPEHAAILDKLLHPEKYA